MYNSVDSTILNFFTFLCDVPLYIFFIKSLQNTSISTYCSMYIKSVNYVSGCLSKPKTNVAFICTSDLNKWLTCKV